MPKTQHIELLLGSAYRVALRLGIEALKFFKDLQDRGALPPGTRLPGETYIPESVGKLPSDELAEDDL